MVQESFSMEFLIKELLMDLYLVLLLAQYFTSMKMIHIDLVRDYHL
jgi:hypothetical protein